MTCHQCECCPDARMAKELPPETYGPPIDWREASFLNKPLAQPLLSSTATVKICSQVRKWEKWRAGTPAGGECLYPHTCERDLARKWESERESGCVSVCVHGSVCGRERLREA